MNLATEGRKPIIISAMTAASGRFRGFGPETERKTRKQEVKTNPAIEAMRNIWRGHNVTEIGINWVVAHEEYPRILEKIRNIECTSKDIEDFSIVLSEFQGESRFSSKAGLFLSALINKCKEDDFVIHTTHLYESIVFIGYHNTKNITVDGHVGNWIGAEIESGTIMVDGDAHDYVGYHMAGGSIVVEGNAGAAVGSDLQNGSITIRGNARAVGDDMRGGEIHVDGSLGYIRAFFGGKIFHRGELIWPKGGGSQ